MSLFTSEYDCKLDAKGRLVLPAKIKSALPADSGNELALRRGFDRCLIINTMIEFKKLYSRIAGLSEFNEENRKLQRNFFRGSTIVEMDGNGRILIPKSMIQYADLKKNIVVVGTGNKIEIWDSEQYKKQEIDDPEVFSELARKHLDD